MASPRGSAEHPVDFRPFESIGVRYEWHARDGRFSMRAEGNGEAQAFSRDKIQGPYADEHVEYYHPRHADKPSNNGIAALGKAYNKRPLLTPYKDLIRWWKASCAELKRATKEDTKRNRTRNVPSYADRAR